MYSRSIQKLIELFSKFPTVGPRTAARFVFYLLGLTKEEIDEITLSINQLKENVKLCSFCYKSFEKEGELCEICSNQSKDKSLLCIVEKETDLIPIEKTKKYQGRYFILGGTVSTFKKDEIKKIRIQELLETVKDSKIKEIIIALNPTSEGEATALYLERNLKPLNKKTSRLGRGLPVGAELEYADEETLGAAFEGRK
ncbi:MAG TPA: recombination mediator RecR [Candidatus Paceibacterota bacterium]|nr:recombination mediator RecR [Candidatus Paceibacterota bacterium]